MVIHIHNYTYLQIIIKYNYINIYKSIYIYCFPVCLVEFFPQFVVALFALSDQLRNLSCHG